MGLEPRLAQEQRQKLILTPQLRTLIRLLQLPIMELKALLQKEMEENPVLEEAPDTEGVPQEEPELKELLKKDEGLDFKEDFGQLLQLEESWKESLYQQSFDRPDRERASRQSYQESLITRPKSLTSHLLDQLSLLELKEVEQRIGEVIIGNIDENGYLQADVADIALTCKVPTSLVERVLFLVQSLDPPGVGGRTLAETLLIQLRDRRGINKVTHQIIKDHLRDLQKRRFDKIAKSLSVPIGKVEEAARLISGLDPKPGRRFSAEAPSTVIPDIIVEGADDELAIVINDRDLPPLRISSLYKKLMKKKDLDQPTKAYIKDKVRAGLWLIRAIEQRHLTLQKITQEIINCQSAFLKRGEPLKPLRLKDIAVRLNLHPSTVSRAVANKFVQSPQGVMALREFFSGKIEATGGRIESKRSIKDKIASLIAEEDRTKPLSDQAIAKILSKQGYKLARRTISKYRQQLKILPASFRKS